uniref:Apple domain-containing protein n=1 Tax=Coccolithus braarudii TaxID=221442 RepID=A0A7S0Q1M3_9EUKA
MGAIDRDTEAAVPPALPKQQTTKRRLFLFLALFSLLWLSLLLYVMHSLRLDEHVSMQDNLDFQGADIGSKYGIESASECSRECEAYPGCFAFTYVKSERACWLKSEGYMSKSNPNTISGSINATLAEQRRREANSSHAEEGEAAWQYNTEFDDTLDRFDDSFNGGEWGEGVAPMRNSIVSNEDIEKFNDSTTYFGNVQLHSMVRSASDCESLCVEKSTCIAWTLDKFQLLCLLRLAKTPPLRFSTDFISGALSEEQLRQRYAEWGLETGNATEDDATPYNGRPWSPLFPQNVAVMDHTDLLGGDYRELRDIDSADRCNHECEQARPNCTAWTLSKHTGACWLKGPEHSKKAQNRSAGLISGELDSATVPTVPAAASRNLSRGPAGDALTRARARV